MKRSIRWAVLGTATVALLGACTQQTPKAATVATQSGPSIALITWAQMNAPKIGQMEDAFKHYDLPGADRIAHTVDPVPDVAMQATWERYLNEIDQATAAFNAGDIDGATSHLTAGTAIMKTLTAQLDALNG